MTSYRFLSSIKKQHFIANRSHWLVFITFVLLYSVLKQQLGNLRDSAGSFNKEV